MKKKYMLIATLLMLVGFAAVSTTLYLNGSTSIIGNKDDFKVYYSDAYVNGEQDLTIIESDTSIKFNTTLSTLGETYVIDYDVTNSSKNYDAQLNMSCASGNQYLTVKNVFDEDTFLKAKDTRRGTLTLQLSKSYTGEDLDVTIDCTINAIAVERDSLAIKNISFTLAGKTYTVPEGTKWKTWLDSSENDTYLVYDEGFEDIYYYDGVTSFGHDPILVYNPTNIEYELFDFAAADYNNGLITDVYVSDPIIDGGNYSIVDTIMMGGGVE